jgi:hypothetical protein
MLTGRRKGFPLSSPAEEAVVRVINGRRVTVQQVKQPFTISVGKDL